MHFIPPESQRPALSAALPTPAFLRIKDVLRVTALSRPTLYRRIAAHAFPARCIWVVGHAAGPRAILRPGSGTLKVTGRRTHITCGHASQFRGRLAAAVR